MKKTLLVMAVVIALAMSTMTTALANGGKGNAPDRATTGNSLISQSDAVSNLTVTAEVANPFAQNFEETFVYYVARFDEVTHSSWAYREPDRIGPDTYEDAWEGSSEAFWFGVSAPNAEGIQSEIVHDGTVWVYYIDGDDVRHLKAEFDNGELLSVNGETTDDIATGNVTWTSVPGVQGLQTAFSVQQDAGTVVHRSPDGDTRTLDVDCSLADGNEAWFSGLIAAADGIYANQVGSRVLVWVNDGEVDDAIGSNALGCDQLGIWRGGGSVTDGNLTVHTS